MIKFPELNTNYVTVSDCSKGNSGLKCPKCKDHIDPTDEEENMISGDCKTLIYENELDNNGKLILKCQCMCYAKEHWQWRETNDL